MNQTEALHNVAIASAHHREILELAINEDVDMTDQLINAGSAVDAAILMAHYNRATLFDIWKAAKTLSVGYILAVTMTPKR